MSAENDQIILRGSSMCVRGSSRPIEKIQTRSQLCHDAKVVGEIMHSNLQVTT